MGQGPSVGGVGLRGGEGPEGRRRGYDVRGGHDGGETISINAFGHPVLVSME